MNEPYAGLAMQAARIHRFGDSSQVRIESVAVPKPAQGEVLVRIRAAGINPVDWKVREGFMGDTVPLPMTLGYDLAGVVVALGSGASTFTVGDRVFGMLQTASPGAYAEFATVPSAWLASIPPELDFDRAAALPMGALTAWLATVERGELARGQRVLIHGGAGAVGISAVQLAKARGAWVAATASGSGLEQLRSLGVDQVIDYQTQRFEDVVSGLDLVVDTQGGETQRRSWTVLRPGGTLVSTLGTPDSSAQASQGKRAAPGFGTTPDGSRLAELAAMAARGSLLIPVARGLPLIEAAQAMDLNQSGKGGGKTVLLVG